jgi:hypothetical protein
LHFERKDCSKVDRHLGILLISLSLLTTAIISVISTSKISNGISVFPVICIGAVFLGGIILLINDSDVHIEDIEELQTTSNEEIEEELERELNNKV